MTAKRHKRVRQRKARYAANRDLDSLDNDSGLGDGDSLRYVIDIRRFAE